MPNTLENILIRTSAKSNNLMVVETERVARDAGTSVKALETKAKGADIPGIVASYAAAIGG